MVYLTRLFGTSVNIGFDSRMGSPVPKEMFLWTKLAL